MKWLRRLFSKSRVVPTANVDEAVEVPDFKNQELSQALKQLLEKRAQRGVNLKTGASDSEIDEFETWLGRKLPGDLEDFYRFTNGFDCDDELLFRIVPLADMITDSKMPGANRYIDHPQDFHLAEYLIYSDMWTVHLDESDSEKYQIYNKADGSVTLTNALADFLKKFIEGGVNGLYGWGEQQKYIKL